MVKNESTKIKRRTGVSEKVSKISRQELIPRFDATIRFFMTSRDLTLSVNDLIQQEQKFRNANGLRSYLITNTSQILPTVKPV